MKWIILPFLLAMLCVNVYGAPGVRLGGSLEDTEFGELEGLSMDKYDIDLKELISQVISGDINGSSLWDNLLSVLFAELRKNNSVLRNVLLICILNGIIATFIEGFVKNGVDKTAYFAAYTAIAGILAAGFRVCTQLLTDGADKIVEIMQAGIPLILCIVSADSGGVTAVSFAGVLSLAVGVLDTFVKNLIVPQIIFSVMLGMLNCLWDRTMVGKLSELFAFLAAWEIRICAFVFVGCLTLGRIGVAPASAAAGKGVRLAVGAVPVVGGLFENSLEAVVSFVGALKGGVAVAVIIIIAAASGAGIIKLCAVMLMYKLTAALSEPMGNKKITEMIDCVGEGVKLLIGAYFTVIIMFVTAVGVMLGSFG